MAKLIGTDPNQVPTNGDLGTMAYQDYDVIAPQLLAGRRNLIINGAMQVWQRGTSQTSDGYASVDRYAIGNGTDGTYTLEQSTDAPDDFKYSLKFTTGTADASLASSQWISIWQRLEGQNVSHLNFGSSSAKTVTLSFWVKSSLTGTFGGSIVNSGNNRSYPFSYAISSANTWEYKTVIISGDTTGTWLDTNGIGIRLFWGLGIGSDRSGADGSWAADELMAPNGAVSVIGTASATWQITGVQLEVGSVATPFEHRSFGEELALCQRYYWKHFGGTTYARYCIGENQTSSQTGGGIAFPVEMRAKPTLQTTGTAGNYALYHQSNIFNCTDIGLDGHVSKHIGWIYANIGSASLVHGGASQIMNNNNASVFLAFDAEL
jgi:hypothetical protein